MTPEEAKSILLLYRPGTADAEDPRVAEALTLADADHDLGAWLADHVARTDALQRKFREIKPPPGLREQIISEYRASKRVNLSQVWRRLGIASAALVVVLGICFAIWHPKPPAENTLALFKADMVGKALRGYTMAVTTSDLPPIRTYLSENGAPADFTMPEGLQHANLVGCDIEGWQGARVAMICFRTGKRLPPGTAADLWLFVAKRKSLESAPDNKVPEFAQVNRLITATWVDGENVYFLGVQGDAAELKKYL